MTNKHKNKIKNVKISYPEEYNEKQWQELYAKRDKLLRISDWTVLDDAELTEECVDEWKRWRKSVKLLTREKFKTVNEATSMLRQIQQLMPSKEYMKKDKKENTLIDEIQLKQIEKRIGESEDDIQKIVSAIEKLTAELKRKDERKIPSELEPLQAFLMDLSRDWYDNEFKRIIDVPMAVAMERCEQAIDYKVTKDLENSPLVSSYMKITNMSADDVSDKFIGDKKKLIYGISKLDQKLWNIQIRIKTNSDIPTLQSMVDELVLD